VIYNKCVIDGKIVDNVDEFSIAFPGQGFDEEEEKFSKVVDAG